jgi:hypothetical protein
MLAQIETMDGIFGADPWPYGVETQTQDPGGAGHLPRLSST